MNDDEKQHVKSKQFVRGRRGEAASATDESDSKFAEGDVIPGNVELDIGPATLTALAEATTGFFDSLSAPGIKQVEAQHDLQIKAMEFGERAEKRRLYIVWFFIVIIAAGVGALFFSSRDADAWRVLSYFAVFIAGMGTKAITSAFGGRRQ